MKKIVEIKSLVEMEKFGKTLGENLSGGEIICLNGNLGAGKTNLTKFIGEGMGISDYITSPTFALLNIYEGRINLYHFDAYRLEDDIDVEELGFDDYFYSDGVCVVEWPENIRRILPKETLEINITNGDFEERILEISTDYYEKYESVLENIK